MNIALNVCAYISYGYIPENIITNSYLPERTVGCSRSRDPAETPGVFPFRGETAEIRSPPLS